MIVPLAAVGAGDDAAVGAKAVNLTRLARLGLPVPEGFCIATGAFHRHRARVADPGGLTRVALDPELVEAVERHLAALGAARVAVRSSATAEDLPGHSFAGQYDSFLDVETLEECLDAIRRCWASLFTERAVAYRRHHGLDDTAVAMGVIVQRLVPAQVSGVLFTIDPVGGHADRIVIEASAGLGEAVVSGRVTPDRIVLGRADLEPVDVQPATPGGAVCLDEACARRLGEMALRAEREFGTPLDIEWALAGGALHLLQARPITTRAAPAEPADPPGQVWTNANAAEALPDPMTPMTWSIVEPVVRVLFETIAGLMGIDLKPVPLLRAFAGRPYFSLNTLVAFARNVPGLRDRSVSELLGGEHGMPAGLGEIEIADAELPDIHVSRLRFALAVPGLLVVGVTHTPWRARGFIERYRARNDRNLDAARGGTASWLELDDERLARAIAEEIDAVVHDREALLYLGVGVAHTVDLYKICRRWLGAEGQTLANSLLAGLGGLEHAEAGLALWSLGRAIGARPEFAAALADEKTFTGFCRRVRGTPGGAGLLESWDAFMLRFGHHALGELELANPRWMERPDEVLGLIRAVARGREGVERGDGDDPVARARRAVEERGAIVTECRRRLRNPLKRLVFEVVLVLARRGAPVRENLRNEVVRRLVHSRLMLLELGARLTRRGVLERDDDVFFLERGELEDAARGCLANATVTERRATHERNRELDPPAVIRGDYDPSRTPEQRPLPVDRVLRGLAVSPGVAIGPARVLLRAGDEPVRPGEILVAPFTDPAWSPHFLNAAAIVMDMGGLLSRGAIVAREYGVPCVVNVGPATRVIRSGQRIRVDGARGIVEILEDQASARDP